MGLKKDRPPITKSNVVCVEPMPGEKELLDDFVKTLRDDHLEALIRQVMQVPEGTRVRATKAMAESLSDLIRTVWEKMRLAGEAGSLLKIEGELQDAIRKGQDEWEERLPLFRLTEYGLSEAPQDRFVRFVPGDVEGEPTTFWDKADNLVRKALDEFVDFASNGGRFQRQLFVEDAKQGLGFVDVCCQGYDVVLMNPPFGDSVPSTVQYIASAFPASKNDLYASFVSRGLELLAGRALLGAITSRVGFFAANLSAWRESNLLGDIGSLTAVADLGHGVLDSALVEAAAYVISRDLSSARPHNAFFASVLDASDKGQRLYDILNESGGTEGSRFSPSLRTVRSLPGSPLAYWLPPALEMAISAMPSLSELGGKAAVGLQTDDDFRFIRLLWEAPNSELGRDKKWVPLSKGGEYSPYFDDLHLALNWKNEGEEIKAFVEKHYNQWSRSVRNVDLYFRSGLTYPERTTSDFSPRPLPANSIFSIKGPGIFFESDDLRLAFLGFAYSRVCKLLLEVFVGLGDAVESGSAARDYRAGIFNSLPFPVDLASTELSEKVRSCVASMQFLYRFDETSTYFCKPVLVQRTSDSLRQCHLSFTAQCEDIWMSILESSWCVDEICASKCGLDRRGKLILSKNVSPHPCEYERGTIDGNVFQNAFAQTIDTLVDDVSSVASSRHLTKKSYWANRRLELLCHKFAAHPESIVAARRRMSAADARELGWLVVDVCSYSCGVVFGRWDVRKAIDPSDEPLRDAFASVPACSAGTLVGVDGLPSNLSPEGYPLCIDWDGILVDDPDHPDDIIRRVRDVLEVIWKDRADAIEKEACEILGVADLRDYFRKPGAGGFWDDHVKRYSKSRRKAPIYWLLQSSKKNYALWIYYHRLDKDILFKALLNYVEPKIRREESRLDELRSQKTALGPAAKGAKKLDKDIDRQEALLSELRDFEDKLRRAANLHLDPDLNDGVVLNIAPLRELVPWKEAKSYWDDLMDGKYEWSSIGKQLREKGIVPC